MDDRHHSDPTVATGVDSLHWETRFAHNGTDYLDFERTLARIERWEDWCRQWGATAEEYEALAQRAEGAAQLVTAGGAWRRAALCWHWAKFLFVIDPRQQREANDRAVACYARGAAGLDPPAEPVRVPYRGTFLAAYLRVPDTADSRPPPFVLMVPGLDSVKEELQATAEFFVERGLAALAIDGPGQGESEYELAIEPAYEQVAAAVMDWAAERAGIDASRAGIFGVSLGGYYAARCMAYEPRLRAGIDLAGPYNFGLEWEDLPPMTRAAFAHRSRSADDAAARAAASQLTLEGAASLITKPLLVVHGGKDGLLGPQHAERVLSEAPGAEPLFYKDGNHGVTNRAFESRAAMADWLASKLGAGARGARRA